MQRNDPDILLYATKLGDLKLVNEILEDEQIASNIDFLDFQECYLGGAKPR